MISCLRRFVDLLSCQSFPSESILDYLPPTVRFFIEPATRSVSIVETEDIDEASLSSAFPSTEPKRPDEVELVLFFFGIDGRTLPGSSVANFLWSLTKSPYRLPMKYSKSPFFFTRKMNSCQSISINPSSSSIQPNLQHVCASGYFS